MIHYLSEQATKKKLNVVVDCFLFNFFVRALSSRFMLVAGNSVSKFKGVMVCKVGYSSNFDI